MKRLLAISWEMPPMYGPRATQVSRTLGQLAEIGWHPTAVCMAPRRGGPHWPNGAAADLPSGVEFVRIPSPEEWVAIRAAWRLMPVLRDYPDPTRVWVPRAAQAAARVAHSGECAGLITFAQPWSDHLVGLRVSRATKLPWVAHFSDPWADSSYATPRQRLIWRPMEEDVIREAAGVVFVTEETLDLVMSKYPEPWRQKAFVVPHGFESRPFGRKSQPAERNGPMRIVYTGRFYTGMRTPIPLLRALADLNTREALSGSLELLFLGAHVDEFEREASALGVASLVRFRGRVSPTAAAAAAAEADVLLVIDAPSHGPSAVLPSKLIDYLPCRRPILGITPESGASARLLRRLGCPVAPPDNIGAISTALAGLIHRWREGTLEIGESFDRVAADFEIGRTTRLLHDVLIRAFDQHREH